MAEEGIKKSLERLQDLDADARKRVEASLKDTIERELVAGPEGGLAASNIFSRGWIFSRLTPTNMAQLRSLPELDKMSAEQFADFAERLAELKARTSPRRLD